MKPTVKLEQDEKKLLLLKMRHILKQIQHLQDELQQVVKLNQKLSAMSFSDSLSVLNQTDPEIVKLKLEFQRFTEKNQGRSSEELLEIHQGVKKIISNHLAHILAFSEKEVPIDKAVVIKTAQSIRKSSKTIIAIESLLNQRQVKPYERLDFSQANQEIEKNIEYIDNKQNTLHTTIKIIQHVTPEGEQSIEYQALIKHLKGGGSLNEVATKFDVEQIDIMENEQSSADKSPANPESHQPQAALTTDSSTDNSGVEKTVKTNDIRQPIAQSNNTKAQAIASPSGLRIFIETLSEWLNTPTKTSWQQAKHRVLEKYSNTDS